MQITKTGLKNFVRLSLAVGWLALLFYEEFGYRDEYRFSRTPFSQILNGMGGTFEEFFNSRAIAILLTFLVLVPALLIPPYLIVWDPFKYYFNLSWDMVAGWYEKLAD